MGFLGILRLRPVASRLRGQVGTAIVALDQAPASADRLARKRRRIRAHVADQADGLSSDIDAFVKMLGNAHGAVGAHAQLAGSFLLQGGGREGRRRMPPGLFAVHAGAGEGSRFDRRDGSPGLGLAGDGEPVELLSVEMGKAGGKAVAARRQEIGVDRPVFPGPEALDLVFALAHQAQGDGLDPAGRARARQFYPEHRRKMEPDKIVERPAGKVCVDQRPVDLARVFHGLADGVSRDFMKDDPADVEIFEPVFLPEQFQDMPGNRLALAVRVGCQEKAAGLPGGARDFVDPLSCARIHLPGHGETVVRIDGALLLGQVADMAVAGEDLPVRTQVFVDGFRLGRGFDDDDVHGSPIIRFRAMRAPHRPAPHMGPQRRGVKQIAGYAATSATRLPGWRSTLPASSSSSRAAATAAESSPNSRTRSSTGVGAGDR